MNNRDLSLHQQMAVQLRPLNRRQTAPLSAKYGVHLESVHLFTYPENPMPDSALKSTLEQTTKAQRGSRGIAPPFL